MVTLVIVNSQAGNGSTGRTWPWLNTFVKGRLGRLETLVTSGPGHATEATYRAIREGRRRIVCVGGDGTLSEVVNGFMAVAPDIRRHCELGIIPNGTGCDFIRSVAIPRQLEEAVRTIARGNSHPIDIGRLWIRRQGDLPFCRHFHNTASFGLGGEVCACVNRTSKAFGPFLSFLWATVTALLRYGKKRVVLRVDDGLFHVSVIGDLSFSEGCRHLPKLYIGRIDRIDKVATWTARRIEAGSPQEVLLEVDGEQPGTLPIVAEIVPKAIHVIMSPP